MLKTMRSDLSGFPIFFESPPCDVHHDAAYAHALVLAMESIEVDGDVASLRDMRERAAELMREWGYVEVEDGKA